MSETKKYKALGPILHDGTNYAAGQFVPMTDECAAYLLNLKGAPRIEVIVEAPTVDPPAGNPAADIVAQPAGDQSAGGPSPAASPKTPDPENVPTKNPTTAAKGKGKK